VEFLGKLVSEKGVSIAPGKMDVLKSWPRPSNAKELQSFLGFMNYHRNHIRNFASVAECLYKLAIEKSFNWFDEHESAFRQLKEEAIRSPLLSHPTPDGTFILDVDASNKHIGGALYQKQNDELVPISFGSYTLLPAQRKYCTTRKELLSLVRFCRTYRHYLLGRPFLVRTDHNSLVWLTRFKHIEGQLARWLEELSQYNMTIEHRKGCEHTNADALSRMGDPLRFCDCYNAGARLGDLPCGGCPYCMRAHNQWSRFQDDVDDVVPLAIMSVRSQTPGSDAVSPNWVDNYEPQQLRDLQTQDPDIGLVIIWLENKVEPSRRELLLTSPSTRSLWSCRQYLLMENGILHYLWSEHPKLGTMSCIVIPQALRQEILCGCHDSKTAGHLGIKKTLERVKGKYFWYGMTKDVELYVLGCKTCNKNKKGNITHRAGQRLYHAGFPMERVHLDIMGPFHVSSRGNRYILVMVDQFTKWVELAAIPEQSAQVTVQAFVDRFISTFGCPLEIHTDQGRNFESDLFQAFCKILEITKTRTTPYRPCSNGQCEVFNRVILQMIRSFISKGLKDWDACLPLIVMALHSMKNQATGFSANMMMLGRETIQPLDLVLGQLDLSSVETVDWVKDLMEKMSHVHQIAREKLGQTQLRQKRDYDLRLHERHFHLGDPVYLRDSSTKVGVSKKLRPPWAGPYIVSEVEHPLYRIESGKKAWRVHHDRLKLCRDDDLPLWLKRRRHILLEKDFVDIVDPDHEVNEPEEDDEQINDFDLDQTLPYMIPDVSDDDVVSIELPLSDSEDGKPCSRTTRGGRQIKKPARYL
jgi:transposase InsO family protein